MTSKRKFQRWAVYDSNGRRRAVALDEETADDQARLLGGRYKRLAPCRKRSGKSHKGRFLRHPHG
jgi:hypothetical protein